MNLNEETTLKLGKSHCIQLTKQCIILAQLKHTTAILNWWVYGIDIN